MIVTIDKDFILLLRVEETASFDHELFCRPNTSSVPKRIAKANQPNVPQENTQRIPGTPGFDKIAFEITLRK